MTDPGPGEPFRLGDTVTFDVTVTDDAPVDCSNVHLSYILRHAQHGHPKTGKSGCTGTFTAELDDLHQTQADLSARITADCADTGGLTAADEVDLPRNLSRCRLAGQGGLATEGADAVSALIAVRAPSSSTECPRPTRP